MLLYLPSAVIFAQELSLTATLENDEVWLGDSVQLTLFLNGSEDAIAPALDIPGIRVEPIGGTVRSSSSVTIINGRRTEDIRKAYVYGYRLTPGTTGIITIPSITVNVDGKSLSTRELSLNVRQPQYSDKFSLKLDFDRDRIYLNEECRLKVHFLYSENLRTLSINIPGIEPFDYTSGPGTSSSERYEININGKPVIFSKDDGNGAAGLSAVLLFRPDIEGSINLSGSTASFESVTGSQRVRDFFGRIQNQEVYGRSVVPGSPAAVTVMQFPKTGRPEYFFGLSGNIRLSLDIEPKEAHIGDPVTLTLEVSGMNNPDVVIPPLGRYLGTGIDIPDTRSSASVSGNTKTLTQTIRVNDSSVTEIPSIRFSYFDTQSETYKYAETTAVPMKILETRIVTAAELEGDESGAEESQKIMLERKREGIYFNYSGKELLETSVPGLERVTGSPAVKTAVIIPPAAFLILVIITTILPQLRSRAAARADRSRALKQMKRYVKRTQAADPKIYLKAFYGKLNMFLKTYGTAEDKLNTSEVRCKIERILYGREEAGEEQAVMLAAETIQMLEMKEGGNEVSA